MSRPGFLAKNEIATFIKMWEIGHTGSVIEARFDWMPGRASVVAGRLRRAGYDLTKRCAGSPMSTKPAPPALKVNRWIRHRNGCRTTISGADEAVVDAFAETFRRAVT